MNLGELAAHLEVEEGEFLELMDLFLKTTGHELERLESALIDKDVPAISMLAHSMKGGAGCLGLGEIQAAAKRIEAAVHRDQPWDWDDDIRSIRATLDQIEEALGRKNRYVKAEDPYCPARSEA